MNVLKKYGFFFIPVCTLVLSLFFYSKLPQELPMQFASDGSVKWTLPKQLGIVILPILQMILLGYYQRMTKKKEMGYFMVILLSVVQLAVLIICTR